MFEIEQATTGEILFYSSNHSQLGKAQRWLWFGALIGLLPVLATQSKGGSFPTFSIVVFGALFGGIWLYLRSLMKPGQPLVVVHEDRIESSLFRGDPKSFSWKEISAISLQMHNNARTLEFKLAEKEGRPDKKNFWNGVNYARPTIPLTAFDEITQERMLEAIRARIDKLAPEDGGAVGELVNEIADEREFQERLKSMAPVPWMTYTMIGLNLLIWLATLSMGGGFAKTSADLLLAWGGNAASEVQRGEWWRLVSATFLHSGFMHVTMNMMGLVAAGITVERIYGHRLFALIYLGSGLCGSALSLHFSAQSSVSVGASGAVFGVTGALLVAVLQHRDKLPKTFSKQTISGLSFFILYSLVQGATKPGIDNAAHVGGLLGGCLLAFVLPERFDMASFKRTFAKQAIVASVIIVAATVSLAAMAPRATVDQARIFASNEIVVQSLKRFDEEMKALQQEQTDIKAGKISEREVDERSRTVHAPVFRKVADDLSKVVFRAGDRRDQLSKNIQRMAELLAEGLAMESTFNEESKKFKPIDPERAIRIETELKKLAEQTQNLAKSTKNKERAEKPARGADNVATNGSTSGSNEIEWSLNLEAFQGGMSVQEVSSLAQKNGHTLKCYGNLQGAERVRKDDTNACWATIRKAWGVPASMTALTFGNDGLRTQLFRFPEASWPQVKQQLDQMGQLLPQTFGIDDETGGPVYGWRMDSGLVFSATPSKGKELTVLWTAKKFVAIDYCANYGQAAKHVHPNYLVPVKELWPEIDCEMPNSQAIQDCRTRLTPRCGR